MDGSPAAKGIAQELIQEFEEARAVQAVQINQEEALVVQQ
jgi:hypothetical protein